LPTALPPPPAPAGASGCRLRTSSSSGRRAREKLRALKWWLPWRPSAPQCSTCRCVGAWWHAPMVLQSSARGKKGSW